MRDWLKRLDVSTLFIEPGSPWENGYCESFNGKLRDELLTMEIFSTLKEATILIEQWRRHDNAHRPHSSLGHQPPAPETIAPASAALAPPRSASSPEASRHRLHQHCGRTTMGGTSMRPLPNPAT